MDLSQLHVSIIPHFLPSPSPQIQIDLTVHNHFEHPVTVQIWDTPLDPRCALLGIIEILDTTTDTLLPIDKVFFSRQMPPSQDSYLEIQSHKEVTNTVTIPNANLDIGREYSVKAKGDWKAVWDNAVENVDVRLLQDLAGANGGSFVSNTVLLRPDRPKAEDEGVK